ncbi:MAG: serine/threonine-protein kinase [Gemmataceae bacterium]
MGDLKWARQPRLFADVAAGLSGLHERGLVHRDLKPSNVILTPDGRAKILDFGFAFAPGEPLPDDPSIVGGVGYIVGTMNYISPEQARDAISARPAADLYSLGCSLYCVLTGTPPFPGGTAKDKIRRQMTLNPTPIAELNPSVPVEFIRVVEKLMAKNPADRPPSAMAARELLLPFATAPKKVAKMSVLDAVGAVDRPGEHPELWTEDERAQLKTVSDLPAPTNEEVLSLDDDTPQPQSSWMVTLAVTGVLLTLALLLSQLRRL